jgi:hypothetical protein
VRDAEAAPALDLREQAAGVDHRPDVADAEIIDQRHLSGFDIDLDFRKADDERIGRPLRG